MPRRPAVNFRLLALGLVCLTSLATTGCVIHDHSNGDDGSTYVDPNPDVIGVSIDPGATLEADPGAGVGVFVELQDDGNWRVWTTCDSEITGYSCAFDLYLTGDGVRLYDTEDLEGYDSASDLGGEVDVTLDTDVDTDGVVVSNDAGAPLRLEVWLDGSPDAEFVYWVQNGSIRQGAPSNPVDFIP